MAAITHLFFSVFAKESVEVNNIEFYIGGAMEVGLYTATGPFEGKESDGAFWGEAHVMEDVTPMNNANPLITSGFSVFENFPTLSLSKGSTTSFKIKHSGDFYMAIAAATDFFFENDHLQVMLGSMGANGMLYGESVSLFGAFRYTPTSDRTTSAPTISAQSCEDTLYVYNANWQNCKKKSVKDQTYKQIDQACDRWNKHGR